VIGDRIQEALENERAGGLAGTTAFVLLTALFLILRFPYHELEPWLGRALEASTGARVALQQVEGELDGLMPKVRARGGVLTWPDGTTLRLRYARIMPAVRFSWLWGQPVLALKVNSDWGNFRGFVRPRSAGVEGRVEEFSLAAIPLSNWGIQAHLTAPAALNLRGEREDESWAGSIAFRAGPGSVAIGTAGVPIPFQTLTGRVSNQEAGLELDGPLEIDGPLGNARLTGRLDGSGPMAQRRLDLELALDLRDPNLANIMTGLGIPIPAGATGLQELRVGGQLTRPIVIPKRSTERARR